MVGELIMAHGRRGVGSPNELKRENKPTACEGILGSSSRTQKTMRSCGCCGAETAVTHQPVLLLLLRPLPHQLLPRPGAASRHRETADMCERPREMICSKRGKRVGGPRRKRGDPPPTTQQQAAESFLSSSPRLAPPLVTIARPLGLSPPHRSTSSPSSLRTPPPPAAGAHPREGADHGRAAPALGAASPPAWR